MIVRQNKSVRRRGLGDVCSDGPGAPFSWQRTKYTVMMCGTNPLTTISNAASKATSDVANAVLPGQYMPMPNPPAPTVTLSSDPAAASAPGAVPAGTDSSGNAVYAVPETAAENQARFKAAIDQYMNEQGDRTPPDTVCSSWASIFDPNCNTMGTALAIGGAVVGTLLLFNLFGGRR